jgi:peptidase M28-like protein
MGRISSALAGALLLLMMGSCRRGPSPREREDLSRILEHVRILSSEIGPRPAGAAPDRAAQDYILKKMTDAGLQAAKQPFERVSLSQGLDVEVATANVVGTLPGSRESVILLGAHHDSRNEACPGASDDASGVAVLLEAARILAGKPHRDTLVFASFGGEETLGLPGSREFVRTWKGGTIRLAITLDFVGAGKLFVAPFPGPPELWANEMLRRAEGEASTRRVFFDPWLVIVPHLMPLPFAADHESFLAAGIPALNLSCQFPAWTYHTPEDRLQRVDAATLLAARDLVVRMIRDADGWNPTALRKDRDYLPMTFFGRPFFLSQDLLLLAALGVGVLALFMLARFRRELVSRTALGDAVRSLLVSIPLTALAVSGPFISQGILRRISKVHHPGWAHPDSHLAVTLLAAALTLWLSLFLARFLRPSNLPGACLVPAILLEGALAGCSLAVARPDIALPFVAATGAMLLSASSLHASRRLALGILGASILVPFLSPAAYRMFLELSGVAVPRYALPAAAAVVFLPWFLFLQHLACMPEALYAKPGGWFFRPATGLILGVTAGGALLGAAWLPSYDSRHPALVSVREEIDLQGHHALASLLSLETLRPIRLEGIPGRALSGAGEAHLRIPFTRAGLPGLKADLEELGGGECRVTVRGAPPGDPRWIGLRLSGAKGLEVERGGSWKPLEEYRRVLFPAGAVVDQSIHLRRHPSEPLLLEGELSYDSDLLGLRPQGPFRTFRFESRVRFQNRLP